LRITLCAAWEQRQCGRRSRGCDEAATVDQAQAFFGTDCCRSSCLRFWNSESVDAGGSRRSSGYIDASVQATRWRCRFLRITVFAPPGRSGRVETVTVAFIFVSVICLLVIALEPCSRGSRCGNRAGHVMATQTEARFGRDFSRSPGVRCSSSCSVDAGHVVAMQKQRPYRRKRDFRMIFADHRVCGLAGVLESCSKGGR